jgi:uncharacterized membrane protein
MLNYLLVLEARVTMEVGDKKEAKDSPESGPKATAIRPREPNATVHVPATFVFTPSRIIALGLFLTFLMLIVGCLAWPSVFWDRFVWPYIWSSTEADAQGHAVDGFTEDYNLVSTAFYGIILAAAVFLIYDAFRKRGIVIDLPYILALVPFVLLGTLARALEDASYFSLPTAYLFIAPQIYGLVGVLVVGLTMLGCRNLGRVWPLLWLPVPFYVLFFVAGFRGDILSAPPVLSAVTMVLLTAALSFDMMKKKHDEKDIPAFLWPFGLQSLAIPLFLVAYWCIYPGAWDLSYSLLELHPLQLAIIPAIAAAATAFLWLLFRFISGQKKSLGPIASGVGTLVFFGHMLDAAATYVAIDWYGYGEKHVLANSLIKAGGTALVMFPMKAVAIGATLYILLVGFKEELDKDPLLKGLLMAALLILGLSPGLRDMFRLVMGV